MENVPGDVVVLGMGVDSSCPIAVGRCVPKNTVNSSANKVAEDKKSFIVGLKKFKTKALGRRREL